MRRVKKEGFFQITPKCVVHVQWLEGDSYAVGVLYEGAKWSTAEDVHEEPLRGLQAALESLLEKDK